MLRPCLGRPGRACPTHALVPAPRSRCPTCQRALDASRGTTTARGLGAAHQQLRATIAADMAAGVVYLCARCHLPIEPDPSRAGDGWHLDHHDDDRTQYLGPSHDDCNTAAGGRKGGARRA